MACSLSAHTTYNISVSCEHAFTKQATELDFRLLHELASGCHRLGSPALVNKNIFVLDTTIYSHKQFVGVFCQCFIKFLVMKSFCTVSETLPVLSKILELKKYFICNTSCSLVLILLKVILIRELSFIMSCYKDGCAVHVIVVVDSSPKILFCIKIMFMQATSDDRPVCAHINF